MHDLIARQHAQIAALCRQYSVRRLEVFGSAARGTEFDPAHSDADFLVAFGPPGDLSPLAQFFGLAEGLGLRSAARSIWWKRAASKTHMFSRGSTRPVSLFMERDARGYLWDVQRAVDAILRFVAGSMK